MDFRLMQLWFLVERKSDSVGKVAAKYEWGKAWLRRMLLNLLSCRLLDRERFGKEKGEFVKFFLIGGGR